LILHAGKIAKAAFMEIESEKQFGQSETLNLPNKNNQFSSSNKKERLT
jgi:flagellar basal body P-ring protein FlgI